MAYTFSILVKDLASSKIAKIAALSDKMGNAGYRNAQKYKRSMHTVPNSINALEQKLERLRHRSNRAFTTENISKYNRQIRSTERELRKLQNLPPASFITRMKRATQGMSGFVGAAGGLYVVRDSFRKMDEQMQAVGQVQAGLMSTNGKVGYSFDNLLQKASAFQDKTIFGDETILQNTTAQLLSFTNITGKAFDGAQQAVLDVTSRLYGAKASGESLRTTAIMLGKALNDPVANLGALSRNGIQFSASQKGIIKNLAESGRLAEAQVLIINELNKQYGGSAEMVAKNGTGKLKQFSNVVGDIQEKLAKGFLPVLNGIIKPLSTGAKWIEKHGELIGKILPLILGLYGGYKLLKLGLLGYKSIQVAVISATKIWTAVQATFNAVMSLNPISLVVIAIVALIAAITYVIYKTDGWGKAWKHTVNGAKLLWESFTLTAKANFNTMTNGIMIGINKIMTGWYKFKSAVGLGDSSENAKMLAKIQADTDERKQAIKAGREKAIKTSALAVAEFTQAGKSLKWNSDRGIFDFTKGLKEKLGIATPDNSALGAGTVALGSGMNGTGGVSESTGLKNATQTIAGGGAKQTHINVTIQKLQDETKIFVSNTEQGIEELGDKVQEMILRAVNSVNQMQTT